MKTNETTPDEGSTSIIVMNDGRIHLQLNITSLRYLINIRLPR
ncbi:hypothetical protein SP41_44 [Salmonella phage 41]|nr:hypothetical protein SP41_44 [Salmonella phage 41]